MIPIPARYLKIHEAGDNTTDYTPVFTDATHTHSPSGSIGSYTPSYFGVHNYSASQSITIWTIDQGTSGTGATIYLTQGSTFYARIAKLTVTNPVVLLGTTNFQSLV